MEIYKLRLKNLRDLVTKEGSRTALANKLDIPVTHLNRYIGKNPARNIGEVFARKTEEKLDLPPHWLDQNHNKSTVPIPFKIPHMDQNGNIIYPDNDNAFIVPYIGVQYLTNASLNNNKSEENIMVLREDVEGLNIDIKNAVYLKITSNAMHPTIKNGDKVLVEYNKNKFDKIENREKYLVKMGEEILPARLFREADGAIRVSFDNLNEKLTYPDRIVTSMDGFTIMGKISLIVTK